MPIVELSIFTAARFTQLQEIENSLLKAEQRLTLLERKMKTIQEALPSLTDDDVWRSAYYELEDMQRKELTLRAEREHLWLKIKNILSEQGKDQAGTLLAFRSVCGPE